ncbi:MAG: extracellular solute-binding protein, partial [Hyphomicrobiales bacterium]|nr:extracellular solute-binding protein [Hyphomicrobiales bacterium]
KFKKRKPGRLADVFNIKRFPGKRAFQRSPDGLLEMFLMANGTPRDQVYEKLSDRKQRDDTFKALEALLPHIVFVDSAGEALEELESGAVVFSIGYSGRAFRKTIAGNIRAIWDGHVYDHGSWAISSNANDRSLAKDFISLATSPQLMAAQARLWPYGPMRKSAAALVGRHARLDIELAPFMPTSEIRLNAGLRRDATFWAENRERLEDRLAALREGFPLGVRVPPPPRKPAPEPVADDSQE